MLTDSILDALSAPANWVLSMLPQAQYTPSSAVGDAFADPASTLGWVNAQQTAVSGGVGFIFNGELLSAMLVSWLAIELVILGVKSVVWIKKALLV